VWEENRAREKGDKSTIDEGRKTHGGSSDVPGKNCLGKGTAVSKERGASAQQLNSGRRCEGRYQRVRPSRELDVLDTKDASSTD